DRRAAPAPRVRELLSSREHIPFMVGGNGDRVLALAAAEADIVGLTGFTSGTGRTHTDLSHFTWTGLADRIAPVRHHAGDRFGALELSVLVQLVEVTDDRRAGAEAFAQDRLDPGTPPVSTVALAVAPSR